MLLRVVIAGFLVVGMGNAVFAAEEGKVGNSWSPTPLGVGAEVPVGAAVSAAEQQPSRQFGMAVNRRGGGATAQAAMEGESVNIDNFDHWGGDTSLSDNFATRVARNDMEWHDLWLMANTPKPGPMPQGLMAVAIFLGNRMTSGYSVRIATVRQIVANRALLITYVENKPRIMVRPDPNSQLGRSTSPWAIYLVPEVDGPVRFFKAGGR